MQYQFQRRKNPEGYKELLVYKRAQELQDFIYQITENFPPTERRRREHMRDSARSVKQNIVEGWKRETTQQYIDFLSFSFGSLAELKEDGEDCLRFNLINQQDFEILAKKCGEIDFLMARLKSALENKISKQETFSPYQRWLGRKLYKETVNAREFDEKLKKIIAQAKGKEGKKEEKGEWDKKRKNIKGAKGLKGDKREKGD